MTNREAIDILTNIKNTPRVTWTNGADTAFDLAIKALEEGKEDIIHSIAEQYNAHHELVPIWLHIGDMKGGEEDEKTGM